MDPRKRIAPSRLYSSFACWPQRSRKFNRPLFPSAGVATAWAAYDLLFRQLATWRREVNGSYASFALGTWIQGAAPFHFSNEPPGVLLGINMVSFKYLGLGRPLACSKCDATILLFLKCAYLIVILIEMCWFFCLKRSKQVPGLKTSPPHPKHAEAALFEAPRAETRCQRRLLLAS